MSACEACHRAKVRCDRQRPCARCLRRGEECVPHLSRQGQGAKQRKRRASQESRPSEDADDTTPGAPAKSEDEQIAQHVRELGRHHYGVKYLVQSWVSFAFARRSFSLLGRASRLAQKSGIPMDDIFCRTRRNILDPIMFDPIRTQQNGLVSEPLKWSDLPPAIRTASSTTGNESNRSERYIMVREAKNGHSRYLLTDAFQRDIVSLWLVEQTWKANEIPTVRLFLHDPSDFDKFTAAINWSMSRYNHPGIQPQPVRVSDLRVKMSKNDCNVQVMDLIYTFEIVTLDHSFYVSEFVVPSRPQKAVEDARALMTSQPAVMDDDAESDDWFEDVGDLVMDEEFETFLELMKDE